MKKIILTGGGTAGHVVPNIALIPKLKALGYEIAYIGSKNGIERDLIGAQNTPYYPISSGKLRRYLSFKNITDGFRVVAGCMAAFRIIKKQKPNIIFSKGGFVAVPVVLAAKMAKIPVIIHESDITIGLANRICAKYATKICCSFPETLKGLDPKKAVLAKTPIRPELLSASRLKGQELYGFGNEKPNLMVIGGSLGSEAINRHLRAILPKLEQKYNIIHICGKGNLDNSISSPSYKQYEYVENIEHLFAVTDIVVSRAGANAIGEFLALKKPNLLIPLPKAQSRGDQILNAKSFESLGYSLVLQEEGLTSEILLAKIQELYDNRGKFIANMKKNNTQDGTEVILGLINELIT